MILSKFIKTNDQQRAPLSTKGLLYSINELFTSIMMTQLSMLSLAPGPCIALVGNENYCCLTLLFRAQSHSPINRGAQFDKLQGHQKEEDTNKENH